MLEDTSLSPWQLLPDSILLQIFSYIEVYDLMRASQSCRAWNRVANDEFVWKHLFYKDWKVKPSIGRAPDKHSWMHEYKRLKYHTPMIESEVLTEHSDQVLHVSFSHNGEMFATSSKDGFIKVWSSSYPATILHSANMTEYRWKYTQFSQFNETDTLLLVSGVHAGVHTTCGEICVFSVEGEFTLQSRVQNKPYDIFGTWYNDTYLLSGDLNWLAHLVSSSLLWLNNAYQETETADKAVVAKMYRFYNKNASSIRTIMVANCVPDSEDCSDSCREKEHDVTTQMESVSNVRGHFLNENISSDNAERRIFARRRHDNSRESDKGVGRGEGMANNVNHDVQATSSSRNPRVRKDSDFDRLRDLGAGSILLEDSWKDEEQLFDSDDDDDFAPYNSWLNNNSDENPRCPLSSPPSVGRKFSKASSSALVLGDDDDGDEESVFLDTREKYLIFTTGSKTYTPHQIGFKRIKPFKFKDKISMNLSEKLAEHRERMLSPSTSPNVMDERVVEHLCDKVDHLIDLHGHIIGMALSPDHRYLYVNNRPWPKNYTIDNPVFPPPIAQEIDIHVIDLVTLKEVGIMLRSHKAYTPNDECFFIFLDVSNEYVASGAEDKHGYLWDRHYGICLAKYPHDDVVNSVAFNPADPEMLVTASDDFTLKIWRSRNRMKKFPALFVH